MQKLKFLRSFVAETVLIEGVAHSDDALFHRFLGNHQRLFSHSYYDTRQINQI